MRYIPVAPGAPAPKTNKTSITTNSATLTFAGDKNNDFMILSYLMK
jgi:hypothetical protein